jgi:hypothetical protein
MGSSTFGLTSVEVVVADLETQAVDSRSTGAPARSVHVTTTVTFLSDLRRRSHSKTVENDRCPHPRPRPRHTPTARAVNAQIATVGGGLRAAVATSVVPRCRWGGRYGSALNRFWEGWWTRGCSGTSSPWWGT